MPALIKVTVPRGVGLLDVRRLRSHAQWYIRQSLRHPGYGAKRFRRRRLRALSFD